MTDTAALNIFVPLSKVDEENRLVYGVVAEEVIDNAGEMFDYASSKGNFQKWSDDAHTSSKGLSKGNLRSMHGSVAAGVLTDLGFDDDNCRIECCAKVVDDNEWKKVLAGVYTGFSMGGRYEKRWTEKMQKGDSTVDQKRYTALPCEVSLVDKPCIPTATFDFVKADGMTIHAHHGDVLDEGAAEELGKVTVEKHSHRSSDGKFSQTPGKAAQQHGGSDPSGHGLSEAKALTNDDAAKLFAKGDNMSEYSPTNDELAARGMALAKAAGKPEGSWLDFSDAARAELVAEHLGKADTSGTDSKPGHVQGTKDNPAEKRRKEAGELEDHIVDEGAAATADVTGSVNIKGQGDQHKKNNTGTGDAHVHKADSGDDLAQGWRAKDGTFFLKKADAIAHNEANAGPKTLAEQLALVKAAVNDIEKGDDEPEDKEGEDEAEETEVAKYVRFFEAAAALPEVAPVLQKGLYEVSRMADVLRSVGSLQIAVASEAAREGDSSGVPATILDGISTLGDALVAMAAEEVAEMTAALATGGANANGGYCYPDAYMALAHTTLGLEKTDLEQSANDRLQKRDPASSNSEGGDQLAKADGEVLQKMSAMEDENKLLKADLASARKEIDEAAPLIKGLMADVERIKALPRPSAPVTSVALSKSDDVSGTTGADGLDLTKFTPDQLADAAIRMAQQNGRSMMASRGGQ